MAKQIDDTKIYELYFEKEMTIKQVAKELGISTGSVCNHIKKNGWTSRRPAYNKVGTHLTEEHKQKISQYHKGKVLSNETRAKMSKSKFVGGVGYKKLRKDGYVEIHFPEHPSASKNGVILEHHLVMECVLGRRLRKDEVVHHINHNRSDNRVENLVVMTNSEHAFLHQEERRKNKEKKS